MGQSLLWFAEGRHSLSGLCTSKLSPWQDCRSVKDFQVASARGNGAEFRRVLHCEADMEPWRTEKGDTLKGTQCRNLDKQRNEGCWAPGSGCPVKKKVHLE